MHSTLYSTPLINSPIKLIIATRSFRSRQVKIICSKNQCWTVFRSNNCYYKRWDFKHISWSSNHKVSSRYDKECMAQKLNPITLKCQLGKLLLHPTVNSLCPDWPANMLEGTTRGIFVGKYKYRISISHQCIFLYRELTY